MTLYISALRFNTVKVFVMKCVNLKKKSLYPRCMYTFGLSLVVNWGYFRIFSSAQTYFFLLLPKLSVGFRSGLCQVRSLCLQGLYLVYDLIFLKGGCMNFDTLQIASNQTP